MLDQRRSLQRSLLLAIATTALILAGLYALGSLRAPAAGAAPSGQITVRAVHASPDAGPVDIYVNGNKVISNTGFFSATNYLGPLPTGSYQVQVVPAGGNPASQAVISATLPLARSGADYSIVARGTISATDSFPFGAELVIDDNTPPAKGSARIRAAHFAADAPPVDILVNGARVLTGLAYRQLSDYLEVPAGSYQLQIAPTGGSPIYTATVQLAAGQVVTGWANGLLGGSGASAFKVTPTIDRSFAAGGQLRLGLVHAVPDAPAVDVYVGTEKIASGLAFGDESFAYVPELNAGSALVSLAPAGQPLGSAVFSATLSLSADTDYTVVARGTLTTTDSFPLGADLLTDDNTPPSFGATKVRVGHFSPDTPAVDIFVGSTRVLTNVTYRAVSGYLELPVSAASAGATSTVVLGAAPTGAPTPVITRAVTLAPGTVNSVFAVGRFTPPQPQQALRILVLNNATYDRVLLRFLHASPGSARVDVFLRDADSSREVQLLAGVPFGRLGAYIPVDPELEIVEVRLAGTATVLASINLRTAGVTPGDGFYTVAATGIATAGEVNLAAPPFALKVVVDDLAPVAPGKARVRVAHLAPDVPSAADTRVDVRLPNGSILFDDVAFGNVTGYIEVDAGAITVNLTDANGQNAIPIALRFLPGTINTVYALGRGGPGVPATESLRVLSAGDAGTLTRVYQPIAAR